MSRIQKENINTPFFHIMVQGNNKEYIFNSLDNINEYMRIMEETKEKIDTTILAYCIMSNHAHILIYQENVENLIKYMYRVNLMYAKYYNKKYDRVGHVFRDRYKTQPIYSEKQLYTCVRYIHDNPVKARICKTPDEYKYSSFCNNIFYTNTEIERNVRKNMYVQENFKSSKEDEFILMENEQNDEELCYKILKEITSENNIKKDEIYQNENLIYLIIKKLKFENNISYRMLENVLGINRKRLRKIAEKNLENLT